jgi:drug/metabolite transporter (DMT)-like permease
MIRIHSHALKACCMLLLASLFWGVSFATMKALGLKQDQLAPEAGTLFWASFSLSVRFAAAAIVMLVWVGRSVLGTTRSELVQGLGLGLIGGAGLLFQMDGVQHTSASTSAFLTQCYCIFIPIIVAVRLHRWPSRTVGLSAAMVLAGVAILSQFDWNDMTMGRGEWETIVASIFFTGQILWLERPVFARNRTGHMTFIMFGATAVVVFPGTFSGWAHLPPALGTLGAPSVLVFLGVLVLFCTLGAYSLMNHWQRHVSATQAGLLYCSEPVFASLFALFMPEWFSAFAGIAYANERLNWHLVLGGSLITMANILIIMEAARNRPAER